MAPATGLPQTPEVVMASGLAGVVDFDSGSTGISESLALVSALSCPAMLVADAFTIGPVTWSYQPSESSYWIKTAVCAHSSDRCSALITFTTKTCSRSGSELPG